MFPETIVVQRYSEEILEPDYVFKHVVIDTNGPYAPLKVDRLVLTKTWFKFDYVIGPLETFEIIHYTTTQLIAAGYYCYKCRTTFFADPNEPNDFTHECKA